MEKKYNWKSFDKEMYKKEEQRGFHLWDRASIEDWKRFDSREYWKDKRRKWEAKNVNIYNS